MTDEIGAKNILRTKLYPPPVSRKHLDRRHLLARLSQYQHRALTLVSAPAGYGKSTLVSCWLAACDSPGAWVSLDDNDNDLRLFLSYVVSAIQRIFPAACSETLSMIEVSQLPPVSVLASSLINELDQIEKRFILVLDDYHLIRDKSVNLLVSNLLDHPCALMHLALIARRDPPLPLNSLRAKGKMIEVRTQDLRFSQDETSAFLQQMTGMPVDKSIADILEEKTEGWVTGLRLAALSWRHSKNIKHILTRLPAENRYVMDYFVTEILSHQPPAVQEYLLKASILNRFCAPLCEAVCRSDTGTGAGGINGREFIDLLESANLFVIPLDDKKEWFRYHHLFQSLLKRQLKRRLKAEEIDTLHRHSAVWFAENGYIDEALAHALESGDNETAARWVKQHRYDIMNREQWNHLNRWLHKFPPHFIQEHPDLLLTKAWVYQRQARYSELFDILDRLEHIVSTGNETPRADRIFWGELQALRSFQYYSTSRAELSKTSARQALANLPVRYHSTRGYALLILSAALQMGGDPRQAKRVVFEALQREEASIAVYKSMLLATLCYTNWIAADLNSLKPTAAQLLKHGQKHDLPETIANGRFFTGILHYQRNNLDLAERFLAPIVGTAGIGELVIPSIVTQCQSSFALSLTYLAMGRAQEASQIIESVIGYILETGNADLLELFQVFKADLALRQGNIAEADFWARNHPPSPLAPAYRFYTPQLTLPKVLLAKRTSKSLIEADRLLSRMYDYYASIHSARVLIDVFILQALLHAAQGKASDALEKLTGALALAEPGGFIRPFLDQGPEMAELLGRLVKQDRTLKFARQTLAAFGSRKTENSVDRVAGENRSPKNLSDQTQVEPLTNREIEVLRILAKGMSNLEISESLYISPETVKRHLSTIYGKLEVKNRQQAIVNAKSLGIL